jgi:hypothetical protein
MRQEVDGLEAAIQRANGREPRREVTRHGVDGGLAPRVQSVAAHSKGISALHAQRELVSVRSDYLRLTGGALVPQG